MSLWNFMGDAIQWGNWFIFSCSFRGFFRSSASLSGFVQFFAHCIGYLIDGELAKGMNKEGIWLVRFCRPEMHSMLAKANF